jgi:hypothetical protein
MCAQEEREHDDRAFGDTSHIASPGSRPVTAGCFEEGALVVRSSAKGRGLIFFRRAERRGALAGGGDAKESYVCD